MTRKTLLAECDKARDALSAIARGIKRAPLEDLIDIGARIDAIEKAAGSILDAEFIGVKARLWTKSAGIGTLELQGKAYAVVLRTAEQHRIDMKACRAKDPKLYSSVLTKFGKTVTAKSTIFKVR